MKKLITQDRVVYYFSDGTSDDVIFGNGSTYSNHATFVVHGNQLLKSRNHQTLEHLLDQYIGLGENISVIEEPYGILHTIKQMAYVISPSNGVLGKVHKTVGQSRLTIETFPSFSHVLIQSQGDLSENEQAQEAIIQEMRKIFPRVEVIGINQRCTVTGTVYVTFTLLPSY